jgi:lysophospholipase L1-like esterase
MSNELPEVGITKDSPDEPLRIGWLKLLQLEFILVGILLSWNSLFTVEVHTNYSAHVMVHEIHHRLLLVGISFLLVGIIILFIPKLSVFLRNNKIFAYLVPMHFWLVLVVLGMELFLRITIYNPPFYSIHTTWFGWVTPQGTSALWGKEGYAITWFEGQIPGEIQTPFQGGDNILVLGDSFTEALQVPNDQKYASVAETILRRDGYNFDLHNFGHSGKAMADYISNLYHYRMLYDPKAIVIQLAENDFVEAFDKGKSNYFVAKNSKIVDIIHTGKYQGKYLVADTLSNNFTFTLLEHVKSRLSLIKEEQNLEGQINMTSVPQSFDTNLAMQQIDLLLEASSGTTLFLIITPSAPYISEDHVELNDLVYENLKALMSNYPQIVLVEPLPEFQNIALSGYLPMGFFNSTQPGVGHLNSQGHEILGRLLAQKIEAVMK